MQSPTAPLTLRHAWPLAPRARRLLGYALAISLLVHLAITWWPLSLPADPADAPLSVTITELPPPPLPLASIEPPLPLPAIEPPPAIKAQAKPPVIARSRPARPAPSRAGDAVASSPEAAPQPAPPARSPSRDAASPAPSAPLTEPVGAPPPAPPSGKMLPPRVDLAYKLYLGTHGFLIGDATYRFEHSGNRYWIHTVGKANGLAALLIRGEGRLESRGLITAEGLQPYEFSFERSDTGKREEAKFDWETGIVTLNEHKTAAIDTPMFDALSLMWQYYFTPPDASKVAFTLATTRRVTRYTVTHEADEAIEWGRGTIDTERWHRRSDDGKNDSYAWLAPSLRYLPVKMRLANKRGSVDVVLDAIRVDAPAKAGADAWAPDISGGASNLTPPLPPPGAAPPPMEFAPGATFPTNTGA